MICAMSCLRITLNRQDLTTDAGFAWVHAADYPALHDTCSRVLHVNELAYYQRVPAIRRKTSFLIGRYAAKQALSSLVHESDYTRIEIASGIFQQPIVKYPSPEPLGVSISHTDKYACAIAFPLIHPLALDVERIDRVSVKAMKSQILPHELQTEALARLPEPTRCAIIWTAKEALSKVLKCGMMSPFCIFETMDLSQEPDWIVGHFKNFGQYKFHAWVLDDHVVSMAVPKRTDIDVDLSTLLHDLLPIGD
uniref:Phosphopantetheinyl transferase n=1 Tax=Candidatus Entotheonella serta TaxID=1652106 RepID=A0A0K0PDF3_9BACT|nr:phosphopantetheinyl transferase [Candidatus Entotheonella serta]